MQKGSYLLLAAICLGLMSMAQMPTAVEIKKLKIKKIVSQNQNDSSAAGRTEWYYNSNGDDTATYYYGTKSNYKIIEYDNKQRIKTIKTFSSTGFETETTIYTYKPDGSSVAVNTDKLYRLTNTTVFDTKGRETSLTVPDGSIRRSVYNTKGQLIKYYTEPKSDGVRINNTYTYNNKGKLVSKVSKGDYPSNITYEYDDNGLLKKSTVITTADADEKEVSVYLYSYEY